MPLVLRSAARSDVGLVRKDNQDSGYAGPSLLVVADGMGGHAGGDVASSIAVAALVGLDGEENGPDALARLAEAISGAQDTIMDAVADDAALAGMGTTVTAILRSGGPPGPWPTSGTRAPTCCATASSPRSPPTTPSSSCWCRRGASPRRRRRTTPSAR